MGKLMTWVVIGLIVWGAWRLWTISRVRAERAREAARSAHAPGAASGGGGDAAETASEARRPGAPELMMQCAVCGVHLPGSEARFAGGKVYCSDAHRDAPGTPVSGDGARRDGR
jgi:uncharacterized protein